MDRWEAKGYLMSNSIFPVEKFDQLKIDLRAASVTLLPVLICHYALNNDFLKRQIAYELQASHVTDTKLKDTCCSLVTKKGVRGCTEHKLNPWGRMMAGRRGTPLCWSQWA